MSASNPTQAAQGSSSSTKVILDKTTFKAGGSDLVTLSGRNILFGTLYELYQYRNIASASEVEFSMNYTYAYVGMTGTTSPSPENAELYRRLGSLNKWCKSECERLGIKELPFWRVYSFEHCQSSEKDVVDQLISKKLLNGDKPTLEARACLYVISLVFESDYIESRPVKVRLKPAIPVVTSDYYYKVIKFAPTVMSFQDGVPLPGNKLYHVPPKLSLVKAKEVADEIVEGAVDLLDEFIGYLNVNELDEDKTAAIRAALNELFN